MKRKGRKLRLSVDVTVGNPKRPNGHADDVREETASNDFFPYSCQEIGATAFPPKGHHNNDNGKNHHNTFGLVLDIDGTLIAEDTNPDDNTNLMLRPGTLDFLAWCLDHKGWALLFPLLLTVAGASVWLGFGRVFAFAPAGLRSTAPFAALAEALPGC